MITREDLLMTPEELAKTAGYNSISSSYETTLNAIRLAAQRKLWKIVSDKAFYMTVDRRGAYVIGVYDFEAIQKILKEG